MAHTLTLLEEAPYSSGYFVCNLCLEKGSGPVYHCASCEFDLHVSCAAIGKQQTHFTHFEHPLYLKSAGHSHTCDGCGDDICSWVFRCDLCDYDLHPLCVRAPRFVLHHSHPHPLTLFKASELSGPCRCDGCGERAVARVYRCSPCNYDLHMSCATLPRKFNHPGHLEHDLTLLLQPPNGRSSYTCNECRQQGKSWLYHCALCRYNLHPDCADISHELPYLNLQNFSQERSAPAHSLMQNASAPIVNNRDLEAAERVLSFVRHSLHSSSHSLGSPSTSSLNDEHDICPTCLEGYDSENPKKTTSCGHHFHLACILEWMERSSRCPICRKMMVGSYSTIRI